MTKDNIKVEGHNFVTHIFNQSFNEFIGKYHNKKYIGTHIGGVKEFIDYDYSKYYHIANDLVNLRESLYSKKILHKHDLVESTKRLAEIYSDSHKFHELQIAIDKYLEYVNKEYRLEMTSIFDKEVKTLDEKLDLLRIKRKQEEEEIKKENKERKAEKQLPEEILEQSIEKFERKGFGEHTI